MSGLHFCDASKDFRITWYNCLPHREDVLHLKLCLYLKGHGFTYILKFHFITKTVYWYTHLCPDCNFVIHGRVFELLDINVFNIKTMCFVQ
jgi:hypothetical protein